MRLFDNLNIDFMGKRTFFYLVSAGILLFGLLNIFIRGINFGIDFKGGSEIALKFSKPVEIARVRNEVDKLGLGNMEVKTFGGSTGILLRTELQEIPKNVLPHVKERLETLLGNILPGVQKKITDSTGNTITYNFQDRSEERHVGKECRSRWS